MVSLHAGILGSGVAAAPVCWWLLASIALLKAPNCVVQLQKQFSSFASKKHKAALQRGRVGVQPLWSLSGNMLR